MSRYWGWAAKGEKIPEAIPAGHWRSFTLLGAITHSGLLATMTVEDSTDTAVFLAFLDQVLCPKLQPGHIVVLDNLSVHKAPIVRERIEATGARLLYLPPYSPDLNPIEKCWAKIKLVLRTLKARTAEPWIRLSPRPLQRSLLRTPWAGCTIADISTLNTKTAVA